VIKIRSLMIEFGDAAKFPVPARPKFKSHERFSCSPARKLNRQIVELKRTLSYRKQMMPPCSNRQKIQFCVARFFQPLAFLNAVASRRDAHV
jgi:hypothetical protein